MTEKLQNKYKILEFCEKNPGVFGNSYPIMMREQLRKLELENTLRKISKINENI